MCLDPDRRPDEHPRPGCPTRGELRQPVDLHERIDHDPPDASVESRRELGHRFVVAVQGNSARIEASTQGQRELSPGAYVEPQAFVGNPTSDGDGQECLARVVNVGVREGVPPSAATISEVGFVDDVGGSAELSARDRSADTPATVSTPASDLVTFDDQTAASRAFTSAGAVTGKPPGSRASACSDPASCVCTTTSALARSRRADQVRSPARCGWRCTATTEHE